MKAENLKRPLPRCEWKVDPQSPWNPWRKAPTPQCARRATWSLDGKPYCQQHAGMVALNELAQRST